MVYYVTMELIGDLFLMLIDGFLRLGEWIRADVRQAIFFGVGILIAILVLRLFIGLLKVLVVAGVLALVTVFLMSFLGV
jgi:hypothetical protein